MIEIKAAVWRHPTKRCTMTGSRLLIDSEGVPHDMGEYALSAEQIAGIEERTPGRTVIAVRLPYSAAAGEATLITSREYVCNKAHKLWPVEYTSAVKLTVLP